MLPTLDLVEKAFTESECMMAMELVPDGLSRIHSKVCYSYYERPALSWIIDYLHNTL